MLRITQNWIELADYDLETARALLSTGRYLYVAFMCQQSVEKLLKALYTTEKEETPPYTHNLIKLLSFLSVGGKLKVEQNRYVELLNSYYIESRYTEEISELSKILTREKAEKILYETEQFVLWLKERM